MERKKIYNEPNEGSESGAKLPSRNSRFLSGVIRENIKSQLTYRYGSVAEWVRLNDLNYGYVNQVLNGIAPGLNLRALFEKEGLLDEPEADRVSK